MYLENKRKKYFLILFFTFGFIQNLTVTGCLKIEAVCRIGGTRLASFRKLFVKSYGVLDWPLNFPFPVPLDFPFVVASAGFILPE